MMPVLPPALKQSPTRLTSCTLIIAFSVMLSACGGGGDEPAAGAGSAGSGPSSAPTGSASSLQESTSAQASGSEAGASSLPAPIASQAFINKTLERVNLARASQRLCGTTTMPAQPALSWDTQIEQAAISHNNWMQSNNTFSHTGENDSDPGVRLSDTGYNWRAVAENIAAGQDSIDAVIDAWLNSPGHCRNIMSGSVTQIAMAFIDGDNTNAYQSYWTMKLAKPA